MKGIQELQKTSTQRKEDESTIDVEKVAISTLAEVGVSTHRKEDNTDIDDRWKNVFTHVCNQLSDFVGFEALLSLAVFRLLACGG